MNFRLLGLQNIKGGEGFEPETLEINNNSVAKFRRTNIVLSNYLIFTRLEFSLIRAYCQVLDKDTRPKVAYNI